MEIKSLDPTTSLFDQLEQAGEGPVTVVFVWVVPEGTLQASIDGWQEEAAHMRAQPGFISAQLYAGVGDKSRVVTVIAVWESAEVLKAAFATPEWQEAVVLPPGGTVVYPMLVRKAAVPGICVA